MLRASEFYRVRHCLASVRMSAEVRGTPREASVDEIAEQGADEHAEFAAGNPSYQQHLAEKELEAWSAGHKYTVYNEQELYLRHEWLEPYFSGHPDRYAIRDDNEVLIIDFKTGPILEIESWSDQLNCYFALVAATHQIRPQQPWLMIISKYNGIFQVPAEWPDKMISQMRHMATVMITGLTVSLPTPGRWCRYCPARLVCPEAPRAIEPYLNGQELPIGADGAELLSRLHVLKKLVSEKISYYEGLVRKDEKILAGKWKVGKGKRYGEITSFTKALPLLANISIDTRAILEACAKLSYAKLRDLLMEEGVLSKKDIEAGLQDILGDLLVFKEGEGSVVEAAPEITQ